MVDINQNSRKQNLTLAGFLFFLAGSIILMGIITGEIFYPEELTYTTAQSMISDLGSTSAS